MNKLIRRILRVVNIGRSSRSRITFKYFLSTSLKRLKKENHLNRTVFRKKLNKGNSKERQFMEVYFQLYDMALLELEDDIVLKSDFKNDIGLDSLDIIEFLMKVESKFAIEIIDDETRDLNTFGDLVYLTFTKTIDEYIK